MPGEPVKLNNYLKKHAHKACRSPQVQAARLITVARNAYQKLQSSAVIINNTRLENPEYYVEIIASLQSLEKKGFQQICVKLRKEFINI